MPGKTGLKKAERLDALLEGLGEEGGPISIQDARVIMVDIDRIHDSPFEHEEQIDPESFHNLVESIKTEGLTDIFYVNEDPEHDGEYFLTAGRHQRKKAAKLAGYTQVAIWVEPPVPRLRLAMRAARENIDRVNISRVNLGFLFKQMIEELGLTQVEIARQINRDRSWVEFCIQVAEAEPDLQQLLEEKPKSRRVISYLRHLTPEERAPIIEQYKEDLLNADGVRSQMEEVIRRRDTAGAADIESSEAAEASDGGAGAVSREPQEDFFAQARSLEGELPGASDQLSPAFAALLAAGHEAAGATSGGPSARPVAGHPRSAGRPLALPSITPSPESTQTKTGAGKAPANAAHVSEAEAAVANRVGRIKATISRFETYLRDLGEEDPDAREHPLLDQLYELVSEARHRGRKAQEQS